MQVHNLLDDEDDWKKIWCDKYDVNYNDNSDKKDESHESFSNYENKKLISLG